MTTELRRAISTEAVNEVWLNPGADRQLLFVPSPLTTRNGARRRIDLTVMSEILPTSDRRYMVYEIGQLSPTLFGLDKPYRSWTKISDVANDNGMIIQGLINFRNVCMSTAYIKRTQTNNTIIAIDYDDNREQIKTDRNFYLRFYSNEWFTTPDGAASDGTKIRGGRVETNADYTAIMNDYNTDLPKPGSCKLFHNGIYVDGITPSDVLLGDWLEYYYDASTVGFFDVPLRDLRSYSSVKDLVRKYMIVQPDNGRTGWDYFDDVEMFLCSPEEDALGAPRNAGFYYANVQANDTRQLTHRDWAIDAVRVQEMFYRQPVRLQYGFGFVRVFLRNAGSLAGLPMDHNLTQELHLMPHEVRKRIMLGTMSNIDEWNAIQLEDSAYMNWIGLPSYDLKDTELPNVFNYYGINKIIERPRHIDGDARVTVPPIIQTDGIIIKYKPDGTLLDITDLTPVQIGNRVVNRDPTWFLADLLPGRHVAGNELDHECEMIQDLGDYAGGLYYRLQGDLDFQEARLGIDYTFQEGTNIAEWKPEHFLSERIWRKADEFHLNQFTRPAIDVIGQRLSVYDGAASGLTMSVGRVDCWLNGYRLIEGLDFYRQQTDIVIVNREYYTAPDLELTILSHGVDMVKPVRRIGFVEHRNLNYKGRFELDIYRGLPVAIGGRLAKPSELAWSELRNGSQVDASFIDGTPYAVMEAISHAPLFLINELTDTPNEAVARDDKVSDFLTVQLPEADYPGPVLVANKHAIVSVFMNSLVNAIVSGALIVPGKNLSDLALDTLVAPWHDQLEYDVTQQDWDWEYVTAHASYRTSSTTISERSYSFLLQANARYCNNLIDLSIYLSIT